MRLNGVLASMALLALLAVLLAAPMHTAAAAAAGADASSSSTGSGARPSPSTPQSYYDLLQVTKMEARDATTLKRSYRRLALQSHPDKLASSASAEEKSAAQERFVALAHAYEILGDARLRTRYDYLLSTGVYVYDSSRDWGDFDASQGFKRERGSKQAKQQAKAQRDAQDRWKEAQELFRRAQEEAEEFALWTSLSIAGVIAALPAAFLFLRRRADAAAESGKRRAAAGELRASQAALLELQAEAERAKKQAEAEEREYARQLRREREQAAAAAAAAAAAGQSSNGESGEWEVVAPSDAADSAAPADADNAVAASADSDSDSDRGARSSGTVLKCALCNKKFKSQAMMTQHEQSALHQKALKQAERAAKKKSKRDE